MPIVISEEVARLELEIAKTNLQEQYINALIQYLGLPLQVFLTAVELDSDIAEMPEEVFKLCTIPLEVRLKIASAVLYGDKLTKD